MNLRYARNAHVAASIATAPGSGCSGPGLLGQAGTNTLGVPGPAEPPEDLKRVAQVRGAGIGFACGQEALAETFQRDGVIVGFF